VFCAAGRLAWASATSSAAAGMPTFPLVADEFGYDCRHDTQQGKSDSNRTEIFSQKSEHMKFL